MGPVRARPCDRGCCRTGHADRKSLGVDALAALLILAALVHAVGVVGDLTSPQDPWDHFRDIAQAQTVRDGAPLSDQYYQGEWAWYNPLLPWVLALGSAATSTSVEVFHVRAGPWLNLLGPVMLYLLGIQLVGRGAAFVGLAIYLFFGIGDGPGWAYATYSPWLYSNNFAEGLFFAAALALVATADRPALLRAVGCGVLMGLTFLAHTAPALILVILACATFAMRWRMLLAIGAAAFAVASPFLYSIGIQYGFGVVNPTPLGWVWEDLPTIGALPLFLKENALLVGLGALGAALTSSWMLRLWLAAAGALLIVALVVPSPMLPAFHFWKWSTAVLVLLAGAALAWLCTTVAARVGMRPARAAFIAAGLMLIAVVGFWPAYVGRADFSPETAARSREEVSAAAFLREVTQPEDVVLGNHYAVRVIIGIAGRKTLAPDPYLANPYVPFAPRSEARDRMMEALQTGDIGAFSELAREWDVAAVVSVSAAECTAAFRMLLPVARFGDVCISRPNVPVGNE